MTTEPTPPTLEEDFAAHWAVVTDLLDKIAAGIGDLAAALDARRGA